MLSATGLSIIGHRTGPGCWKDKYGPGHEPQRAVNTLTSRGRTGKDEFMWPHSICPRRTRRGGKVKFLVFRPILSHSVPFGPLSPILIPVGSRSPLAGSVDLTGGGRPEGQSLRSSRTLGPPFYGERVFSRLARALVRLRQVSKRRQGPEPGTS